MVTNLTPVKAHLGCTPPLATPALSLSLHPAPRSLVLALNMAGPVLFPLL